MVPLEVTACWPMAITHPGLHHTGRSLCLSLTPPSSSLSLPWKEKEKRWKGEEQSSLPSFSSAPGLDFLPSDPLIYCDIDEKWTGRNGRGLRQQQERCSCVRKSTKGCGHPATSIPGTQKGRNGRTERWLTYPEMPVRDRQPSECSHLPQAVVYLPWLVTLEVFCRFLGGCSSSSSSSSSSSESKSITWKLKDERGKRQGEPRMRQSFHNIFSLFYNDWDHFLNVGFICFPAATLFNYSVIFLTFHLSTQSFHLSQSFQKGVSVKY